MSKRILFFLAFLIAIAFIIQCSSDKRLYNTLEDRGGDFSNIIMFLSDSLLADKKDTLLSREDLKMIPQIAPSVERLEENHLLSNDPRIPQNCVYYKNKNCITFFIKREKGLFTYTDYLLAYENLVPVLCGVGNFYTVEQDEHVKWLDIKVKQVGGYSLITVKYNKPFYND